MSTRRDVSWYVSSRLKKGQRYRKAAQYWLKLACSIKTCKPGPRQYIASSQMEGRCTSKIYRTNLVIVHKCRGNIHTIAYSFPLMSSKLSKCAIYVQETNPRIITKKVTNHNEFQTRRSVRYEDGESAPHDAPRKQQEPRFGRLTYLSSAGVFSSQGSSSLLNCPSRQLEAVMAPLSCAGTRTRCLLDPIGR